MTVGKNSQYNYSAIIRIRNAAGLIEPPHLDIRPALTRIFYSDNTEYTPSGDDNWSRVSWKTLGNGRFYWIIADFSQVVDPFLELRPIQKTSYLTQLTIALGLGDVGVRQITVARSKGIKRGMLLEIRDLDPANAVSVQVSVLAVNYVTHAVTVTAFTTPITGIPTALSRVSRVYTKAVQLSVPTPSRAFFEALDFRNPLNTLVP